MKICLLRVKLYYGGFYLALNLSAVYCLCVYAGMHTRMCNNCIIAHRFNNHFPGKPGLAGCGLSLLHWSIINLYPDYYWSVILRKTVPLYMSCHNVSIVITFFI